ncbi:hypothetical protein PHLCEN_2v7871 [Hermanssonia centrifuga]|uniref:Transmembrane protein n=1 Tax=Hermanssonia centrifuga TaxID=98765 RepID=A0A2R6NV83_9APHY|nr:hypothetical protein PHLCEN_2v7871 [Hermanssonia centrifuga]
MSTNAVDIYLYEPSAANSRIHLWETVDFAAGSYQATLKPKWWNSTASVNLQLAIVEAGTPAFMASLPAGPVFTATYTAPSSGETPVDADTTIPENATQLVNNLPKDTHLSKGKVAAAVLMPIIVVLVIIGVVYIKMSRKKVKQEHKRWSQAVDKRMSTIATDWKAMSPAGAQAAIRNSMAVDGAGVRASSFSFGAIRPASTIALEGGQAGVGAMGLAAEQGGIDLTTPQMSQLRSGPRINTSTADRVSRVSFAADTRPSGEARRSQYGPNSHTSRAFHVGHVPPLPSRQDSTGDLGFMSPGGAMSPTQAAGPLSLSVEDINSRMVGQEAGPRPSVDEMMPALSMMRTGLTGVDDMLLSPKSPMSPFAQTQLPTPPAATHQPPIGLVPMQPMPASVMSPDEMLRAYAERRAVASPPPMGSPTMPSPVASFNGNGMRTLYSPVTPTSAAPMLPDTHRMSIAPTEYSKYDEEDAYGGTAE